MQYSYVCENGHRETKIRPVANRNDPVPCPVCSLQMKRDIHDEIGSVKSGESEEFLSDALGVAPNQIREAQQRFPHHRFAPDGRMIVKGYQEGKRIIKDLGFDKYKN